MMESHRTALDTKTDEDERISTLEGHLYDPARPGQEPPDDVCQIADRLVITDQGRLFYCCKDGTVTERSVRRREDGGLMADLVVDGTRWCPRLEPLIRSVWPGALAERPEFESEQEWREWYDSEADEDRSWLGGLADKTRPDDADIVHRPSGQITAFFRMG